MPTYDYRCKDCSHELEVVQSFTDDALTTCEQCGGALRKVFGSVGISFKGSGFYKNDSRTSGTKGGDNGSSSDSKGSDSSSSEAKGTDTKSDTKPDKKSDTASASPGKATASTSGS